MRISKIMWKNYRQYQDQTVEFPQNSKYDLHYFIAENGVGKTTFFNSVSWCLYGEELYLTDKDRAFSILSKSVKKEMSIGEIQPVTVELVVECEKGKIHYIREAYMRKTEEGEIAQREVRRRVITVFVGEESNTYEEKDTELFVDQFVPERLRAYYFFDAESLKDYFGNDSLEKVKTAVFEISDIETMRIMVDHLGRVEQDYRTEITRNNPKTKQMNVELESSLEQKELKIKEKQHLQQEIETANKGLAECQQVLDNEENVEELEIRRNKVNTSINEYEGKGGKLENIKTELKSFVRRYTVLLNTYPQMKKMHEKICEMDENNELPPKITKEYLMEMKSVHRCLVCDRDFDGPSLTRIENLIEKHRSKDTMKELNTIRGYLEMQMVEVSEYPIRRDSLLNRLKEIQERLEELHDEKKVIDSSYFSIPDIEKAKYFAAMRKKYEDSKLQKTVDLELTKRSIDDLTKRCENLSDEIDNEIAKEKTHDNAVKCKTLVSDGKKIIEQIIIDIQDEIREQISNNTGEVFKTLMWKEITYSFVGLTVDYALSARDDDGEEGVGSTSGAEGQLLALSFILALQSVSGFNSPLIIDTPVARTSGLLRGNFCNILREVSKNKQLILFFTEDEFNSSVKNALQDYASNRYSMSLVEEKYIEMRCLNG